MNHNKLIVWILVLVYLSMFVTAGKVTYKLNICGKSMYPAMNKDSECGVYEVQTVSSSDDYMVNDVVCYYDIFFNSIICHRIISIGEEHICTKGDNNLSGDSCFEFKYLYLKVIS